MGAIKKQAKNIIVKVKNKHTTIVGETYTNTADKITYEATNGNLTFVSNKKINIQSEKGIKFGDYTPPEERKNENPQIVNVQFINENNIILSQSTISGVEGGNATNFLYGKKLKIKIITKDLEDGRKINFKLKGKTKSHSQDFFGINKLDWELEIKNNECETDFFTLPILWYGEDFETYDYTNHKTTIKADDLNAFMVEISLGAKTSCLPKKENWLKPIAYRRNYEELIGLFKTDNSGDKDLSNNYENKFISLTPEILNLVREFSEFIQTESLTIEAIKDRVKADAEQLWKIAVKQVQGCSLDDRPLYWARNKMQVRLKRHPLFENDMNFEESLVNSSSVLNDIIISFEELSRNYTGVDFSGKSGKKLLITGFDPFVLDPTKGGNPLQSNPSGINALALHGKTIGDYYIQTFIAPVRYKDFDEFKGGKGIIEKFVTPFVSKVDMIITASQGDVFRFDIDRFPAKNRGGFTDNMHWGSGSDDNKSYFKQLTIGGKEFYETTLPYKKIVPVLNNPSDAFWVYFNQTFEAVGKVYRNANIQGIQLIEHISDGTSENNYIINDLKELQSLQSIKGSGSNYLSNEIYYRVAKLRAEMKPNLQTGHLHVPLTQYGRSFPDSRGNIVTIDINPKIGELIDKIREIITKI